MCKINFVDFWPGFSCQDDIIWKYLSKEYGATLDLNPDLLVCSVFGNTKNNYRCKKLLLSHENFHRWIRYVPTAYPHDIDYIISNNTRGGLRIKSTCRHFHNICGASEINETNQDKFFNRDFISDILPHKNKFCSFVFSNGSNDEGCIYRDNLFHELNAYKKVDSAGPYLNNTNGERAPHGHEYLSWLAKYKFAIAFENSSGEGYFTEKIIRPYLAGTVPIYWAHSSYNDYFNPHSMIFCSNIVSTVQKIAEIDQDPYKYEKILREPAFLTNELPSFIASEKLYLFLDEIMNDLNMVKIEKL